MWYGPKQLQQVRHVARLCWTLFKVLISPGLKGKVEHS